MRVGLRFSKGGYANGQSTSQKVTLWITVPGMSLVGDAPMERRHGKITQVTMSYADFETTECKITIQSPSDELVGQMLAVVIEPSHFHANLRRDRYWYSVYSRNVGFKPPALAGEVSAPRL